MNLKKKSFSILNNGKKNTNTFLFVEQKWKENETNVILWANDETLASCDRPGVLYPPCLGEKTFSLKREVGIFRRRCIVDMMKMKSLENDQQQIKNRICRSSDS